MSTEKVNETNTSKDKKVPTVAQTLKQEDQWICWNIEEKDGRETKVPIDPHGSGYADTTDPDTWTSYEDAIEYKEQADCDGIGFVFTEEGWYVGVDLDDCRDPDSGQLEDWAEDVVDTLDSYTEISPSGEGLHIYVEGTLRGLENNRKDELDVEGDGHLEMYEESRFFTFTENHLRGSKKTVENRQNPIEEVGQKYLEDDEDHSQKDFDPDDIELDLSDEEIIEKAKSAENGDEFERLWNGDISDYDGDHSRADLALLNKLAFWTACDYDQMERLFSKSGLSREKWENREDYRERSINKAIQSCTEVYDPDSGSDDEYDHACEKGILAVDDITVHNGSYHRVQERTTEEGDTYFDYDELLTYTIEVEAVTVDENGNKIYKLRLISADGENEETVHIQPDVFANPRKYSNNVEGDTIWAGNYCSRRAITDIKKIIAKQAREVQRKEAVRKIGLHDDELVTPEKIITADGKNEREHDYIENDSTVEQSWQLEDLDYDEKEAREVLERLPSVRRDDEAIPVIGWYFATPHTKTIRETEGEIMSVMGDGERETGKTALFSLMQQILGMDANGFDVEQSKFNLLRYYSDSISVPVYFDEFKPSEISKTSLDTFKKFFKKSTRGLKASRGHKDQSQQSYRLTSPVSFTGEQKIRGSAETSRIIPVKFHEPTHEQKINWVKLTGENAKGVTLDPHPDGYDPYHLSKALYDMALNQDKEEVVEIWNKTVREINEITEEEQLRISSRGLTGLSQVYFGWKMYMGLANKIDADMSKLPSEDTIIENIKLLAQEMEIDERESDLENFLKLLSDAGRKGYLRRGEDYEFVNENSEKETELVLEMRRCHQAIMSMRKDRNLDAYEFLDDPDVYIDRARADDEGYVTDGSKVVGNSSVTFSRGIAFSTEKITEEIDNFDLNALKIQD